MNSKPKNRHNNTRPPLSEKNGRDARKLLVYIDGLPSIGKTDISMRTVTNLRRQGNQVRYLKTPDPPSVERKFSGVNTSAQPWPQMSNLNEIIVIDGHKDYSLLCPKNESERLFFQRFLSQAKVFTVSKAHLIN